MLVFVSIEGIVIISKKDVFKTCFDVILHYKMVVQMYLINFKDSFGFWGKLCNRSSNIHSGVVQLQIVNRK